MWCLFVLIVFASGLVSREEALKEAFYRMRARVDAKVIAKAARLGEAYTKAERFTDNGTEVKTNKSTRALSNFFPSFVFLFLSGCGLCDRMSSLVTCFLSSLLSFCTSNGLPDVLRKSNFFLVPQVLVYFLVQGRDVGHCRASKLFERSPDCLF